MMEITYTTDLTGVDWNALKTAVAADDFDNGRTAEQMRISSENSAVNIFAYAGGEIVGTARALSDGVCNAYVVDIWTKTPYRKRGIARRMMEMIGERVPGQHVYLAADEQVRPFYEKLGFTPWDVGMGRVIDHWLRAE
ncbi:MAG: GNAT family N-acetyltransferase [Caldilineaceae bacterium]|nr:GNAT family N-acetyltransferase [Caldilineaceae bacterium]HRJ40911.1 GNAT family N-acetyltransferase [Caldilineaceae bacterium]